MPTQWNARIIGHSTHFRGTSFVGVLEQSPAFPTGRSLAGAVYVARVTGGVSGNFSITVLGKVGKHPSNPALPNSDAGNVGTTVSIAGVTNVSAAGTYVLSPYGYNSSGVGSLVDGTTWTRIDQTVMPAMVAFEPTTAPTAGVSAHVLVSACLWVG